MAEEGKKKEKRTIIKLGKEAKIVKPVTISAAPPTPQPTAKPKPKPKKEG